MADTTTPVDTDAYCVYHKTTFDKRTGCPHCNANRNAAKQQTQS